jgi:hypothetical protein
VPKSDCVDVRNHRFQAPSTRDQGMTPRRISLGGPGLRVDTGDEGRNPTQPPGRMRPTDDSFRSRFIYFVLWMHRSVEDIASHLERMVTAVYEGQIHEMCPHNQSCLDYWLEVCMYFTY